MAAALRPRVTRIPAVHTAKRSAFEAEVMSALRRRPTRGFSAAELHEALRTGKTVNAVRVLLAKLHAEGYVTRQFAYERDERIGQLVGQYRYRAAE